MTEDGASEPNWRVHQVLLTEEAIYGLILVSGMIVVSGQSGTASIEVLVTVIVTVAVFYAAHVYAGAVARLAAVGRTGHLRHALAHAARQSSGLLVAAVVPVVILALGTTHVIPDTTANWAALVVNTVMLAVLGWIAISRWSESWAARIVGSVVVHQCQPWSVAREQHPPRVANQLGHHDVGVEGPDRRQRPPELGPGACGTRPRVEDQLPVQWHRRFRMLIGGHQQHLVAGGAQCLRVDTGQCPQPRGQPQHPHPIVPAASPRAPTPRMASS